jgi:hypothetical protein
MNILEKILHSGICGLAIILLTSLGLLAGSFVIRLSRSRKPLVLFLLFAFIPLLLGVIGTVISYRKCDRIDPNWRTEWSEEDQKKLRTEAEMPFHIGIVSTGILASIGSLGFMVKRNSTTKSVQLASVEDHVRSSGF